MGIGARMFRAVIGHWMLFWIVLFAAPRDEWVDVTIKLGAVPESFLPVAIIWGARGTLVLCLRLRLKDQSEKRE